MRASRLFLIFMIFILAFLSCGSSSGTVRENVQANPNQPSWITQQKKDKEYYYYVGYAEDVGATVEVKDKALLNAKGKIASSIFEEAEVEKVFTTSGGISDNEELQKNYKENIRSKSAVNLSGVDIEDQYQEQENDADLKVTKVWVLVKITVKNLEKERARIISELQRKLALVDNNLKQAQSFLDSGRALDAVNSYVSAAISSTKVKERVDEFPIYINQAGKVLSGMIIEAQENPASMDTVKGGQFQFIVYYSTENGKVPVPGAKITFAVRNNDGEYTKNAVSDKTGAVVCKISRLKEVRSDNILTARLNADFPEILDSGNDNKKYYSTLKEYLEKVSSSSGFKTLSAENRNVPTTVIAMVNDNGELRVLPNLASEGQSALIGKGYKVVRFSESISLKDIYEAKQAALDQLSAKGIKRVFVLYVSSEDKPKYNEDLQRYMGVYSVSAQLIDTATGEILSAKNIKISATAQAEKSVFESFIKAAGNQIKKLIE